MKWKLSLAALVSSFTFSTLLAQSTTPDAGSDSMDDVMIQGNAPQAASPSAFQEERSRILSNLKTEVEPNLLKADMERLNRNVMRLGSYRRDWVQKAKEFLVANAALAELYLYRYSLAKNVRLNRQIVNTLIELPSYRFPRAALAFMEVLVIRPEDKPHVLRLLERVVAQNGEIGPEVLNVLRGPWGQDIPLENRLRFAAKACASSRTNSNRDLFLSWLDSGRTLWERVEAAELASCLKGAS